MFLIQFFLTALQEGNDEQVTGLLTAKARTETAKHDLVVRSPGSPSAQFSVGELEMVSGGAYVNSQWSETTPDGLTQLFDIIWVLRQQTDGWRIAGMATRVAANEQPTYLNFENPKEMIRKWNAADKRQPLRLRYRGFFRPRPQFPQGPAAPILCQCSPIDP
mgnify:CR=1 FL=1